MKNEKINPLFGEYALGSGTAYFPNYSFLNNDADNPYYQVLSLKSNELKFNQIKIRTIPPILDLAVDKDDNLWVLADHLYVVKNNTEKPIKVSNHDFGDDIWSFLKVKIKTDEIYIYNADEFYVWSDAKPEAYDPDHTRMEITNTTNNKGDHVNIAETTEEKLISTITIIIVVAIIILILIGLACSISKKFK